MPKSTINPITDYEFFRVLEIALYSEMQKKVYDIPSSIVVNNKQYSELSADEKVQFETQATENCKFIMELCLRYPELIKPFEDNVNKYLQQAESVGFLNRASVKTVLKTVFSVIDTQAKQFAIQALIKISQAEFTQVLQNVRALTLKESSQKGLTQGVARTGGFGAVQHGMARPGNIGQRPGGFGSVQNAVEEAAELATQQKNQQAAELATQKKNKQASE